MFYTFTLGHSLWSGHITVVMVILYLQVHRWVVLKVCFHILSLCSIQMFILIVAPSGTESEYSRSNPPSYPSSGPPSAPTVPQSEPPSYPSSGPPSGHFQNNPQQQRLSMPSLSTRFPPPTYDEAMEEREEEDGVDKKSLAVNVNCCIFYLPCVNFGVRTWLTSWGQP